MPTVNNVATTDAPSLTVHDGNIWMAWKGEQGDQGVYVCHTNGTNPDASGNYSFSPQQKVLDITTSLSPAIVSCAGTLYLFWRGEAAAEIYWATSPDGSTWTDEGPIGIGISLGGANNTRAVTDLAPTAATDGTSVYLCWVGSASQNLEGTIWYSAYEGVWAFQSQILPASGGTPMTSSPVAIAAQNGILHIVWEGRGSTGIWWTSGSLVVSRYNPVLSWAPEQEIFDDVVACEPSMAVAGNGDVWLTWVKSPYNKAPLWPPAPGTDYWSSNHLAFASLASGAKQWSIESVRVGIAPGTRAAMASYGSDHYAILMAWSDQSQAISYGPLGTPSRSYQFSFQSLACVTARSGDLILGKGTDTDYAVMSVQASGGGDKPITGTTVVGDISGGQSRSPGFFSPLAPVSVPDNAQLVMTYQIYNSSLPESQALQLVSSVSEKLVSAGASYAASAAGDALGTLIGTALGTSAVPLLGSALGALAGFLVSNIWGKLFPDCDGPIGSAVRAFVAADLTTLPNGSPTSIQDQQPSPNMQPPMVTQDGCGSNPFYLVTWSIAPAD